MTIRKLNNMVYRGMPRNSGAKEVPKGWENFKDKFIPEVEKRERVSGQGLSRSFNESPSTARQDDEARNLKVSDRQKNKEAKQLEPKAQEIAENAARREHEMTKEANSEDMQESIESLFDFLKVQYFKHGMRVNIKLIREILAGTRYNEMVVALETFEQMFKSEGFIDVSEIGLVPIPKPKGKESDEESGNS